MIFYKATMIYQAHPCSKKGALLKSSKSNCSPPPPHTCSRDDVLLLPLLCCRQLLGVAHQEGAAAVLPAAGGHDLRTAAEGAGGEDPRGVQRDPHLQTRRCGAECVASGERDVQLPVDRVGYLRVCFCFSEQYDAFVKFTHDQLMRRFGEQPASCE